MNNFGAFFCSFQVKPTAKYLPNVAAEVDETLCRKITNQLKKEVVVPDEKIVERTSLVNWYN